MKRFYRTILFSLVLTIPACAESYEQPREVDPKDYNMRIVEGIETKAEWVKSPQNIAKYLFPRDAHQEGNGSSYSVEENRLSKTVRTVAITEEGALDDEVKGEKAIIGFKLKNDRWVITKIYISLKRRY